MIHNNQLREHVFSPSQEEVLSILLPWQKEYWKAVKLKKEELKQEILFLENQRSDHTVAIRELKKTRRKLTDAAINSLKNDLKEYLFFEQKKRCYYCEGEFYKNRTGVGKPTIDHIANKAIYPHFLYISRNLVLACSECNGFTKKGTKNVIVSGCTKTNYYDLNSDDFTFVHPYLDKKEEHMDYDEENNVWFTVNHSEKGRKSIEIFQLNEPYYVIGRYKKDNESLNEDDENMIETITNYTE
ncbi:MULTISPECIES: hypothetical protein [unclassified Exiguobacterium]|uniref:hypothetical protein n=1 Tax=unclassified Exiguobacterium TaxID=2644629 RepID=UPI001038978A|nr:MULTISPECIES: hypothetical protein [unclassified Exiguobacterium]TCI73597.1 hypothetical protein EVJ19_00215 [Exiguobacterium sp. IPCI3]TCI82754.1 hypothetical protein EVJ18_00215 [Exiguobacterium sp. IPCH1]TCI83808.1 hypothetical protein EVJ17_00215 [Exiguobacterium sp. IPBC4]